MAFQLWNPMFFWPDTRKDLFCNCIPCHSDHSVIVGSHLEDDLQALLQLTTSIQKCNSYFVFFIYEKSQEQSASYISCPEINVINYQFHILESLTNQIKTLIAIYLYSRDVKLTLEDCHWNNCMNTVLTSVKIFTFNIKVETQMDCKTETSVVISNLHIQHKGEP